MSEPNRYRVANNQAQLTLGGNILAVDPFGPLVDYIDYARLKAEVERLAREQRLKAIPVEAQLLDRIKELKAEVERLRKAGDAMALNLYIPIRHEIYSELLSEWNAAKEGKPSV
jgi:hypothetical protein